MKIFAFLALAIVLASCSTTTLHSDAGRAPSSDVDLSGDYLGEGDFTARSWKEANHPPIRLYLDRAQDGSGAYHGVLVEYQRLFAIAPGYIAANYLPKLSDRTDFYLNSISTRISAYKFVPGAKVGKFQTYQMHGLKVRDGQIIPDTASTMVLHVDTTNANSKHKLLGAKITGNPDGQIEFPVPPESIRDFRHASAFEFAAFIYQLGNLKSTWRGNWENLEGSYLSEYGRLRDGVLELYSEGGQKKMKFLKPDPKVKAEFTNKKSATLVGDYYVSDSQIPKMYVLTPVNKTNSASDRELSSRIGLFLDVFDASAPEAGEQMVTELAFTNNRDDAGAEKDFLMYYEHPQHRRNIGIERERRSKPH